MIEERIVIATYLRVSTAKQETVAQRQAITRWIVQRRYPKAEIVEYADEAMTGANTDRPSFQQMMRDVRAGKITKVITFEISRLVRFRDACTAAAPSLPV